MSTGSEEGTEHPLEMHQDGTTQVPQPQQNEIDEFWRRRQADIEEMVDFKEHILPMAGLMKIIHAKYDSVMMSPDTPPFLTKMCELFIQELSIHAWKCAVSHDCCIILESDIAEAITSTESYDFLTDVLHMQGVEVTTKEPFETDMDQASTSRNAAQILQERLSHMSIAPAAVTPIVDLGGAMFNSLEDEYNKNLVNKMNSSNNAIYVGQCGSTTHPFSSNPSFPMANDIVCTVTNTIDPNHISSEGMENYSMHSSGGTDGRSGCDGSLVATNGMSLQQKRQEGLIDEKCDTVVDQKDSEVAWDEGVNKCNINSGEHERDDEFTLYDFVKEIQVEEEALFPDTNLCPSTNAQPDLEESIKDEDLGNMSNILSRNTAKTK